MSPTVPHSSLHSPLARPPHLPSRSPPPGPATPPVCAHAGDAQGTVRPPSLMAVLPARATSRLTPRFTHPSRLRAFVQAGSVRGMGGASWGQASWGAHESGACESGARAREGLRKWEGAHGTRAVQPRQRIMGGHHSGGGELVEGHLTYA
jgi:hypothetical protein